MQAAGFDAPAREDTLTGTRPGELIHAAFELTGFVDRGYQTADLKASGVIGISMRHLDSSTWHLDAASQGVGLVASPRVIPVCHSLVVAASGVSTDVGRIERGLPLQSRWGGCLWVCDSRADASAGSQVISMKNNNINRLLPPP